MKLQNFLTGSSVLIYHQTGVNCGLLRTDCTLGPLQGHHPNAGKEYVKHFVQNTNYTVPFLKKGYAFFSEMVRYDL